MSSQSPHSPLADEHLNRFTEHGGEDYSDLFGKALAGNDDRGGQSASLETLKLQTRLSNMSSKSWVGLVANCRFSVARATFVPQL